MIAFTTETQGANHKTKGVNSCPGEPPAAKGELFGDLMGIFKFIFWEVPDRELGTDFWSVQS
jgi:hypothetical protein